MKKKKIAKIQKVAKPTQFRPKSRPVQVLDPSDFVLYAKLLENRGFSLFSHTFGKKGSRKIPKLYSARQFRPLHTLRKGIRFLAILHAK
jgi:hypothetical protein